MGASSRPEMPAEQQEDEQLWRELENGWRQLENESKEG